MSVPRILISCNLANFGGCETHVYYLSKHLREKGAEVTLAAQSCELNDGWRNELVARGVEIITTPFAWETPYRPLRHIYALATFGVRLRRDYDVLVGIGHGGLHRLLIPFVKRGGFTLFNLVAAPAGLSKSVIFAMKGMDGIITMSPSIALALRQHYYVRKPMASLPHLHGPVLPIDVDLTRRRIGHEGILRIGFFGRLSTLKRPDLLVRLWKTLDIGPARLEIFGDGEIDHSLREQINSLGLGGVVTMHGRYSQEESIRRVSETDLVVLPSQGEGLPQVLLESMAAGVPFVATNVGGVSDLGKENPDVEICKTDEYAIKAAIETMVKKIRNGKISPTRLQAIYQKKYSFKIVAEQWQKALFDPDSFFFSN